MIIKLLFFIRKNFVKISFLSLFFLSSNNYSQCAGDDASLTICDIQNPINKNINLFSLLGGSPTGGGTWIDNSKPSEQSTFNGILNAQDLRNTGIYTYSYIQDPSACSDNQATITVKIGPYAGVASPNVSTCDDVDSFNLFSAFDGTKLAPLQNGVWTANNTPATLSGSIINPRLLGEGTYSYNYTIAAVDSCPAQTATVSITVFRKPRSGTPSPLVICSTDVTSYTNLNLNDRLSNYDTGGIWTDQSGTNELTSVGDNRINVVNIYNTRGAGTYSFTYTVLSSSPICTDSRTTVNITIEDPIDFRGSTLTVNSDICENEISSATYSAILRKGPAAIPNGNYDVRYTINNGTTTKTMNVNGDFINGNFVFNIDKTDLQAVGNYTFTITRIVNRAFSNVCTNILGTISDVLSISALPRIDSGTVKIDPTCTGYGAQVEISGNTNLANGTYRITYNLSGDNTATNQQLTFTAINGVVLFSIPANLIPNAGDNILFSITNIVNTTTTCSNTVNLSKAFTVNETPDVSGVTMSIANECIEGDTVVEISGLGELANVSLNYSLTGDNVISNQTASVTVEKGKATYIIPASTLVNLGTTTFTLNSLIDDSNVCGTLVSNNNTASFTLTNCNVFIPDGFSPNGDTVNDTFRIPQIEFLFPNFSLEIFNRYGNLLFRGNKDKPAWDGKNSDYKIGIDGVAPNGVYFYVIHFNKGNKKPTQGRLYLNR